MYIIGGWESVDICIVAVEYHCKIPKEANSNGKIRKNYNNSFKISHLIWVYMFANKMISLLEHVQRHHNLYLWRSGTIDALNFCAAHRYEINNVYEW